MTKRLYIMALGAVLVCGLLLAAVLVPSGADSVATGATDLTTTPPTATTTPDNMVWIPGGTFTMGLDFYPVPGEENPHRVKNDEYPAHEVDLDGYWLEETPITNRMFAEFVEMTGYVTFAEKKPTREDFARSGVDASLIPEDKLNAGSICYNRNFDRDNLVTGVQNWEYQVWHVVDGADWRHPEGPDSNIDDRMDHPVVHVNWDDAVAYCNWAGKRLPTEAEFEFASRNGGQDILYPWGNELVPEGKYLANFWQGEFPLTFDNADGYATTSPVRAFPSNELGLYDISGNVWEWCADLYHADYYRESPRRNPQGPTESFDPTEPGIVKRVQRGGSFMCNVNNCTGYRSSARMRGEIMSSSFHGGFRCALDPSGLDAYHAAQAKIAAWRKSRATDQPSPGAAPDETS
ncbi:MAG: formylglycine-generating enzyme family protein [Planctomycetaceae bacterium]|nr:formylglycine-generating enzyme family protein [Planctomycetaceae bacterium]